MRVIAGEYRSRILKTLPGMATRPTPDRMRESLFSILAPRIEGSHFVDAFAGTGAVGIEALSRGARLVTFIEKSRAAIEVIRENLATLKATPRAAVIQGRASDYLAKEGADIVFLDPPYDAEREYRACFDELEVKPPELVLVQHSVRFALEERYGALARYRELKQGDNVISFYRQE
jgi:16S rRNA (guanine966-N2)-methyltransferase